MTLGILPFAKYSTCTLPDHTFHRGTEYSIGSVLRGNVKGAGLGSAAAEKSAAPTIPGAMCADGSFLRFQFTRTKLGFE